MAGGRPPKPTELLRVHGGLREDRHADREYEPKPEGDAMQLAPLDGEALEAWNFLWPRLTKLGLATELDSHELTAMCQWWARYQRYIQVPEDDYRSHNMAVASYKQFRVIAAKFGLTPTDRVGLKGNAPTVDDELADLIA